jgi:apolipoprotein N-acyltransferase
LRLQLALHSRLSLLLDTLLAVGLGGLHSLTLARTDLWWLQMLLLGALAWRVAALSVRRAAGFGLAFGTTWLAASTWWLYISMHQYGGLPAWLAVLAVLALSAFSTLYLTAALALFARWAKGLSSVRKALLFSSLWLLAEVARGMFFTGFPWAASGYAHTDGPLAALAPWIGVYGLGFVSAALASWLAFSLRKSCQLQTGIAAVIVAGALGAAAWLGPWQFTQPASTFTAALLQGNVPQNEKFELANLPKTLAWVHEQLLTMPADLVIAPETVIPVFPDQLDPVYWQSLLNHFQKSTGAGAQAAILGVPLGGDAQGYSNSAVGLSAQTRQLTEGFYRYDKHHLVPFGEFVPTGFRWFTELMSIPLGDFNRGALGPASFAHRGERIGVNICYEDLFGEELATRFAEAGFEPTMLANISNIGWFGNTVAIHQHLQISRMRTLELQRPMLRATNTGATVIIDHTGHVAHSLPVYTQGVLSGKVQGRTGITPFAWWAARFGLCPLVLGACVLVWVARRGSAKKV